MIGYGDAPAAIDWLSAAFGFQEDADQRYTERHGPMFDQRVG
jgi:uncharacterized glyoxalase superfamily protein PhnB